ncbi:MAG: hypothetical protein A2341_21345 [Deltaproteobacteria bacterium RIFOXYB12_FULL_58_9]|nr:MAG: hypothetical protein A2341_21345 [Deltaproteobacteria bacterium RIFOXYB12_FULL_58_9]
MKPRRLHTTLIEDKALWRLDDGQLAFVKIAASNSRNYVNDLRNKYNVEKTCLEVLKGLAVPKILDFDPTQTPQFKEQKSIFCLAQSFAGKHAAHGLNLTIDELVGVWIFLVEQMAAFRRHQILYTDLKCHNIMGRTNPLQVTIVDFDYGSPLISGQKHLERYGYTPGNQAPEIERGEKPTEQTLVFESGLLLFHFLTDQKQEMLKHPKYGLSHAVSIMKRLRVDDLIPLLVSCLEEQPHKRPLHYEEILEVIKATKLPPQIRKTWEQLKSPYIDRLAEVSL